MKKLLLVLMLVSLSGAGPHYKEKYSAPINESVISNFDGGTTSSWLKYSGASGDTILDDAIHVRNGTKSIAFYSVNNSAVAARYVISNADYTNRDYFGLTFYFDVSDKSALETVSDNNIDIKFGSGATPLTDNYTVSIPMSDINSVDNWYKLYLHKKMFTRAGVADWSNITRCYIIFRSRNATPVKVTMDQLTVANSPITNGGIVFAMDVTLKTSYEIAKSIFPRYGFTASLFNSLATTEMDSSASTIKKSDLISLQNMGWDIGSRGYKKDDTATTLSVTGLDTQYSHIKRIQKEIGLRCNINAYPYGRHNRTVDSVGEHYFDFCRIASTALYHQAIKTNNVIFPFPLGTSKSALHMFTFNGHSLADLTDIVDSAVANNWISSILFHQFGDSTSGGMIDTTVLKTFLAYAQSRVQSGDLSTESGRLSNYFVYAPDSCAINKSTSATTASYTTNDSIALFVDSCKVFLYDSVASGSKTLRDSTSVLHGGDNFSITRSGLNNGTQYFYWLKVRNASGEIDSTYSVQSITTNSIPDIAVQPVSDTVTAGQSAMFFVTASGSGLVYQWYRNDSLIAGATNDTFTYTARSQVGNYTDNIYCLLTTDTTISTDTVNLLVNGIVFRQSTDTLKLVCSNNQNVQSWQWYKNNVAISGATDSVLLVVVDSTSATKSVYYCEISNGVENKKVGDWTIERKANSRTVSRRNKYK